MADTNTVASKFQGLPIAELIAAPLKAACDSQRLLAGSAYEFMMQIGFEKTKDGEKATPRLLEFELERPIEGADGTSKVQVKAPFLGLVPIPSLLIDDVQIDFQMEITDTETITEKESKEASVDVSAKFGWFRGVSVNVHGKVTSSRENTRSSNQTAKYQVHVSARQQPPTEGLAKLMDIMAACIEPIPSK